LGILILIPSVLILLTTIIAFIILPLFGIASGVNILLLLPFFFLSIFTLSLSGIGIYIGIRYLKKRGFKKNRSLGVVLITVGLAYFGYTVLGYIFSNLTDNIGGEFKVILSFLWLLISFPLGLGFKNGVR